MIADQTKKLFTFNEAMSETLRCVWIVSNWSKHHSNSSIVSPANLRYASSPGTIGFCRGVAAALFDLFRFRKRKRKFKTSQLETRNYFEHLLNRRHIGETQKVVAHLSKTSQYLGEWCYNQIFAAVTEILFEILLKCFLLKLTKCFNLQRNNYRTWSSQ